jgi:signal transduction histidine kinase
MLLRTLIQLREEIALLRQENSALADQNRALLAQVEAERRTRNEVELLKSAIVRTVSHELRTPLVQVKSAVSMLAEDTKNEQLSTYATEAMARLEILVRNITQLGESLEANRSPIMIREVVDYAMRSLRRVWDKRDRPERVHTLIPADLPPVYADKLGISTVLLQLLDNALKFSDGQVYLRAELCEDRQALRLIISDDGIGIAQDQLEKIFELFFQIDPSYTRRYGGMGVGLALVKLILDNHETQIEVHSTPGEGSAFQFMLPVIAL